MGGLERTSSSQGTSGASYANRRKGGPTGTARNADSVGANHFGTGSSSNPPVNARQKPLPTGATRKLSQKLEAFAKKISKKFKKLCQNLKFKSSSSQVKGQNEVVEPGPELASQPVPKKASENFQEALDKFKDKASPADLFKLRRDLCDQVVKEASGHAYTEGWSTFESGEQVRGVFLDIRSKEVRDELGNLAAVLDQIDEGLTEEQIAASRIGKEMVSQLSDPDQAMDAVRQFNALPEDVRNLVYIELDGGHETEVASMWKSLGSMYSALGSEDQAAVRAMAKDCLKYQMGEEKSTSAFLRKNQFGIKLFVEVFNHHLGDAIGDRMDSAMREIAGNGLSSLDVRPHKISEEERKDSVLMSARAEEMAKIVNPMMQEIVNEIATDKYPELRDMLSVFDESAPKSLQKLDKNLGPEEARDFAREHARNFIFLRGVSPRFTSPHRYGLLQDIETLQPRQQDNLILAGMVTLSCGLQVPYKTDKEHLMIYNHLIVGDPDNVSVVNRLADTLVPKGDE